MEQVRGDARASCGIHVVESETTNKRKGAFMTSERTTGYTPGPWKYENDIEMIVSRHPEWNWSSICKLATGEDSRQEEANARLIALAPEMAEALGDVRSYLDAIKAQAAHIGEQSAVLSKLARLDTILSRLRTTGIRLKWLKQELYH